MRCKNCFLIRDLAYKPPRWLDLDSRLEAVHVVSLQSHFEKPVLPPKSLTVNLIAGVAYEHLIVVTSLPTYGTHFAVDALPRLQVFGNQSL